MLNAAITASMAKPIRPCNICTHTAARPDSAPTMETPPTNAEKVSDSGGLPRMLPWMSEMERPKTVAEKSSCATRRARVRMLSPETILVRTCVCVCKFQLIHA